MSSLIMIMRRQLHLHENRGTITPMMTHQLGAATGVGIDLHLGQKPKLGGRYADDSLIYISYFVGSFVYSYFAFFIVLVLVFISSKTQKEQKYFRCFSLFGSLVFHPWVVLLAISVCYLKNPKIFCFVCYFLPLLLQKLKTPKIFVVLLRFCKVVAEFSLPLLHWSLVFTLSYSSHASEEQ
jgi:hypothetical protein